MSAYPDNSESDAVYILRQFRYCSVHDKSRKIPGVKSAVTQNQHGLSSLYHRMLGAGSHLEILFSPTPLPKKGQKEQFTPEHIQEVGRKPHNLSGQLAPASSE